MSAHANFLQRRPLAEARTLLLAGVAPVAAEEVCVDDAAGRIAAVTVMAAHPAPHYRAAAMDGYAVRASDTWAASEAPITLRLLAAGETPGREPCCAPVDTGALLPEWADAVVRIEDTAAVDGGCRITSVVPPGCDVRRVGEDIAAGTILVPEGARIRPWDIAAMLATGTTRVRVRQRPRVAILATGGEVVEPPEAAAPGQVIEYNSRMIAALVEEWGGSAHRLGIVADDEASLARAISDAATRFDVVGVIAGSSAGRRDFTIAALASLGDVFVHGVDIAPGRPVALARLSPKEKKGSDPFFENKRGLTPFSRPSEGATPAIAIPGYPVSAVVVCEQLLRPLVEALLGSTGAPGARMQARIARKIPSRLGMEEFRRVCVTRQTGGGYVVAPLASGAGSISTVSGAHAWLRIAAAVEGLDAGADVDVELIVSRDDVDSAFVLAGEPCAASAALEAELRRTSPRARVHFLRRGAADQIASVERGEAHGAILSDTDAEGAGTAFERRTLPATGMTLVLGHDRR
ncbi:MAG: molybdopterin-binding protein [Candidatus Binatia bacterium]